MIAAAHTLTHMPTLATWILQDQQVGFDLLSLWHQMGILAKIVVGILFVMSGWSFGVMIDRYMAFNAARVPLLRQLQARCGMERLTKPSRWRSATRRAIWPRLLPQA